MTTFTQIYGDDQIQPLSISDGVISATAAIAYSKLATPPIAANGTSTVSANIPWNSKRITGLQDPVDPQDAATRNYVDSVAQGLSPKASVRAATTGPINLATFGLGTLDTTVTLVSGNRVLVKDQSTSSQNGIYIASAGAWSRATDMDADAEFPGAYCFVEEGTLNAGTGWVCTVPASFTIGNPVTFVKFSESAPYTAGNGIDITSYVVSAKVDALTGTTWINGSSQIAVQLNVAGAIVATGGTGLIINVGTGIEINGNALRIASAAAGTGLSYLAGVLSVNYARFIKREVPSGLINHSNTVYTLAHTPVAGSEEVFFNGLLQNVGALNDYTISGGTITFNFAPKVGSIILVSYTY